MARKKSNMPDLTGSTIDELMSLDNLYQLDKDSSKAVLNRLVSAANKRLRRLMKLDIPSPALIQRREGASGATGNGVTVNMKLTKTKKMKIKMFSSKGLKTTNEVRSQIRHVQNFLKSDTSTVKGYRKYRNGIVDRMGREFKNKSEEKRFWKVYEMLKDKYGGEIYEVYRSDQVQKWLLEESGGRRMNRKDLYDSMVIRMNEEYQKKIDKENAIDDEEEENPFTEDDLPF